MAWTTPKTWTSEVVSSADMNTYLSDNTQYLYDEVTYTPGKYSYIRTGGNYSTTSNTLVDMDASNMVATITTDGGNVLVTFAGTLVRSGGTAGTVVIGVDYDGTIYRPAYLFVDTTPGPGLNAAFSFILDSVSAGSHTFRMKWAILTAGTTAIIAASVGQSAHFSVQELK